MAPRERGRNQTLLREMLIEATLTKQTFDLFFSQSCDIKSEFSSIICSYLRRLVIQNSLMHGDTSDFFRSASKSIGIVY